MRRAQNLREVIRRKSTAQLLWALETAGAWLQERVALELGRRRAKDAVGPLRKRLFSSDAAVREAAAEALGLLRDKSAGDDLLKLFADHDQPEGIRDTCAYALARLRYAPALQELLRALDDRSATVRLCVAAALAAIGDPESYHRVNLRLQIESDEEVKQAMRKLLSSLPRRRKRTTLSLRGAKTQAVNRLNALEGPAVFRSAPKSRLWPSPAKRSKSETTQALPHTVQVSVLKPHGEYEPLSQRKKRKVLNKLPTAA